jgi:acetamidase/formamidase
MMIVHIHPTRESLHGHFNKALKPILSIESGDTVRFKTLDADWITDFSVSLENPPKTMVMRFVALFMSKGQKSGWP